jgi:hypothetical protein
MRIFILVFCLLTSTISFAQDETIRSLQKEAVRTLKREIEDTTKKFWKTGGIYSINIGQGSLSNWAAGGDDFSLSINSMLNVFAFYQKGKSSWDNTLEFNLGYVKTTSLGSRKNDDRIDFLSKYGHALSPKWNLSTLFNFRSQFFKGFNYPDNVKTFISGFLAPGYILLSVGLDYKPNKDLSVFISPFTSRWIIVKDDTLSAKGLYGVMPGKKSANELGAFASISYLKALTKTITYKSRLDLFSNYQHNPQNIDLFMTNVLSAKFSKSLAMNWSVDMIYDDDVRLFGPDKTSASLQLKSILGVGLTVKF